MGCEILLYRGSALIVFGLLILVCIVISKVKNNRDSKADSDVKADSELRADSDVKTDSGIKIDEVGNGNF